MSTVGGLSSSTTSSLRGYGGLASGLDRDELIESMTAGTKSKIQKTEKEKTKLEWQQEAMREFIDKMYNFNENYMSYTNSNTNLLSTSIYNNRTTTSQGANAGKVSVTGKSSVIDSMVVHAVTQMAKKASATFNVNASDRTLASGITRTDLAAEYSYNAIGEGSFTITYGNKEYEVTLGSTEKGYKYDTAQDVVDSLNKAFKEVSIGSGEKNLGQVLKADYVEATKRMVLLYNDDAGNSFALKSDGDGILAKLGFVGTDGKFSSLENKSMSDGGILVGTEEATLKEETTTADRIGGKTITFGFNGVSKKIKLLSAEEIKAASSDTDPDGGMEALVKDLQEKLDNAYGKNRIEVEYDETKKTISFKSLNDSMLLEITGGSSDVIGEEGLFKDFRSGDSNRVNTRATLFEAGLQYAGKLNNDSWNWDTDGVLTINGAEIKIEETDSIKDIMDKINSSDAKVTVSYLAEADRFSITSTANGSSGDVDIKASKMAAALFGCSFTDATGTYGTDNPTGAYTKQEGRDAKMWVDYGDGQAVEVTRDTNSFNLNGMKFNISGTFNVDADGNRTTDTEAVSFQSTVNSDKAVETIKNMVKDINEIIDWVNKEVSTKPKKDYTPLTSEEEDELSESELEKWYEKAKSGMFFGDSDLRSLASALRSMTSGSYSALKAIGITTATDYSDNGKLVLDEEKLKSALEKDPDQVYQALAGSKEDGSAASDGLMVRLQNIVKKYAGTTGATKGILVNRAGSTHAPTSVLSNSIQKQLDDLDDQIDLLWDRLEAEQDRYISQFTTLERLISQMNSQSGYLSSFLGG